MTSPDLYRIGEVAAILGVSPHTVRAWERRHHVVKPDRTSSGQRRYRLEEVERLREVKRAINLNGLSLRLAIRTVAGSESIDMRVKAPMARSAATLPPSAKETMWRGVVDVMPQLVFVLDRSGRIIESNIATARLFGVTVQQIRDRPFVDLVEPFDRAKAALIHGPPARTVDGWELNLSTPKAARMYSFQSWAVRRGGSDVLVLVGSSMFTESLPALGSAKDPPPAPDHGGASAYHRWLDGLLSDPRFQQAMSARRLGEVAMQHLRGLLPAVECAIAIANAPGSPRRWAITYSAGAHHILEGEPDAADAFRRAIHAAAAVGAREDIPTSIGGRRHIVTAIPLGHNDRLGAIAWSRPVDEPPTDYERRAVDAFVAWIALAAERSRVQSDTVRQSSRFNDVLKAASVVRDRSESATAGVSFLKQLASLAQSDIAALGRIDGSDFIVEAVFTPGESLTKPGDRFPLLRVFSNAIRRRQTTRGTNIPAGLPKRFMKSYGQIRHFLAAPLVFHGRASHLISLARFGDPPFSQAEADIVQALAATAVLAITTPTDRVSQVRRRRPIRTS